MSHIEELNQKFVDRFTIEADSLVNDLKEAYHKKHPIAACILIGNGTALVCDSDDVVMHKMNWAQYDKICAQDPERNRDEVYEIFNAQRVAANCDPFIRFLCDLQNHEMYQGTLSNIKF